MNAHADAGSQLDLSPVAALEARVSTVEALERAEPKTQRMFLDSSPCCPRCKCNAVRRSHRKGFDWLMSAIGFRPARCYTCDKRFYVRDSLVRG
jgi:hypothetical protein